MSVSPPQPTNGPTDTRGTAGTFSSSSVNPKERNKSRKSLFVRGLNRAQGFLLGTNFIILYYHYYYIIYQGLYDVMLNTMCTDKTLPYPGSLPLEWLVAVKHSQDFFLDVFLHASTISLSALQRGSGTIDSWMTV